MTTMIKLTGINKIYRTHEIETQALENVNLEVKKGEFLSIMGPSGCGKSTLLNIMGLLDSPTSGTIEINGTNTINMGDKELAAFRNKTLGFVFQTSIGKSRPQPPHEAHAYPAIGWSVPACSHRPCHRGQSGHYPCRRTDR